MCVARHQGLNGVNSVSLPQLLTHIGLTQGARNLGQRAQVFGWVIGWREQGENQVDRLFIQRCEINWRFQTHEHAMHPVQAWERRMRNGYAMTDAGGPDPLAFHQSVENFRGFHIQRARGDLGDDGKGLPLRGRVRPRADRAAIQ